MNKIEYFPAWKESYLNCFPISDLQTEWDALRNYNITLQQFPSEISRILTAEFSELLDWYFCYLHIDSYEKSHFVKKISKIFDYNKYYHCIISFFTEHISELTIYSCSYCDISIATEYNKSGKRLSLDLDHFLPKGENECPLLALSLKNLVPSCQVCNSRIKGKTGLLKFYGIESLPESEQKELLICLSPTSEKYRFAEDAKFSVELKNGAIKKFSYLDNLNCYSIKITTNNIYEHETEAFLYEQRYNSIPVLSKALSLLDLKRKYPASKINEIKNILNKSKKFTTSVQEIEEIIFRKNYDKKNHNCINKLKNDILDYS